MGEPMGVLSDEGRPASIAGVRWAALFFMALATLGLGSIATAQPASAHNFESGCTPGEPFSCSLVHYSEATYTWEGACGNQFPGICSAFNRSLETVLDNTTVLSLRRADVSAPEVWVTDANYGIGQPEGRVDCSGDKVWSRGVVSGNHNWCHGKKMKFNGFYSDYYDTVILRWKLTCHELGHSVGLRHTAAEDSCMNEQAPPEFEDVSTSLDSHDRRHINEWYSGRVAKKGDVTGGVIHDD